MKKKVKIILILVIVIVAVLIVLNLLGQQAPKTQVEQETPAPQEYPNNFIEGIVKEVDLEGKTLKLEAKTSLIETAEKDVMEKTIRFSEDTEWKIYHTTTEEESPFEFSGIKVDDNILVMTLESTFEKINELEEFTANKITKIVSE